MKFKYSNKSLKKGDTDLLNPAKPSENLKRFSATIYVKPGRRFKIKLHGAVKGTFIFTRPNKNLSLVGLDENIQPYVRKASQHFLDSVMVSENDALERSRSKWLLVKFPTVLLTFPELEKSFRKAAERIGLSKANAINKSTKNSERANKKLQSELVDLGLIHDRKQDKIDSFEKLAKNVKEEFGIEEDDANKTTSEGKNEEQTVKVETFFRAATDENKTNEQAEENNAAKNDVQDSNIQNNDVQNDDQNKDIQNKDSDGNIIIEEESEDASINPSI